MSKFSFISIPNAFNSEMIYLSQGFEEVLGFSRDNWIGKAAIALFHPEDRERISIIIETCIRLHKLATLVYTRMLSVCGYQTFEICINHCCDTIVCSNRLLRGEDLPSIFERTSLSDNIITVTGDQDINVMGDSGVFNTTFNLGQALCQSDINPVSPESKERLCYMILDHIDIFRIKYCSSLAIIVLESYCEELIGTSIMDYVDPEDLYDVKEELTEVIKDEAVSNRIHFTFVSRSGQKIELQTCVSYTDDGLILIAQINQEEDMSSTDETSKYHLFK